jgi:alpha-mannosidase
MKEHPHWKINLEIEPATWDSVEINHPSYYKEFKQLVSDSAYASRIDFVNPSVAQSYLYNISGESIIRQFQYGMKKLHDHFPAIRFLTYSPEEPCWTSALPEILRSLGFKFAVLKNPNTDWGGYSRAHGGELVNWIGPDGTSILAVPRYAVEKLQPGSTWQTIAFGNSKNYIHASLKYGIKHPIGMTYQDCGWKFGPWLGNAVKHYYKPSRYVTWTHYFKSIAIPSTGDDWHLNQEDLKVALMWGSQVLQRLAQQERTTNNQLLQAGKIASIAAIYANAVYPEALFHRAWRNLLLSQHHDCWIVPYNIVPYYGKGHHVTWADQVKIWTRESDSITDRIVSRANDALSKTAGPAGSQPGYKYVRVYNTSGSERSGIARVILPAGWPKKNNVQVYDDSGHVLSSQISVDPETNAKAVLFQVRIPSMGYATYELAGATIKRDRQRGSHVTLLKNGKYLIETDLYKVIVDPSKGGTIESLIGKKMGNKQFVDQSSERKLNELRGYFYAVQRFYSSADSAAKVSVVENGPLEVRLKIQGKIAQSPFIQYVTFAQGRRRIDLRTHINWEGNPGIGKFAQTKYDSKDLVKAFYNDRYKLQVVFPLNLKRQQVYKNAPFSVMKSALHNTFFNRWDSIKNNIVLNWVDVTDSHDKYGLALLTDQTTSYLHGEHDLLGLTLQYSGKGLWGRNYPITGPTDVRYAIVPHRGRWDEAGISQASRFFNEPFVVRFTNASSFQHDAQRSLIRIPDTGYEISSVTCLGNDLIVRLFNGAGDGSDHRVIFNCAADGAEAIQLNGKVVRQFVLHSDDAGTSSIRLSMPRFGFRTIRLINVRQ